MFFYVLAQEEGSSPNNGDDISRYPMTNRLVCGLRDRFEPRIAEAVRAKRVTDTVSGLLRDVQLESFKL